MKIIIIGAGMAGLMAGNLLKRAGHDIEIYEKQSAVPNNHSAVLRFRSPAVGDALGIPFKSVMMTKASMEWSNPVADALAYAHKCSGVYRADRSLPLTVAREERWIAPEDFIPRMAERLRTHCAFDVSFNKENIGSFGGTPIVSTMPMPALANVLGYKHLPQFQSVSGFNIKAQVKNCEAYVSLYIPSPEFDFNRLSITGGELIVEYADQLPREMNDEKATDDLQLAALLLGIDPDDITGWVIKAQQYAKIQPIETGARKRFIAWATDNFNVFSFGRFAVWKPGLLLDDLIEDIRKIERWLEGDRYAMRDAR